MKIEATQFEAAGPTELDPSLGEIAAACLQIQSRWNPAERLRRMRTDWRPSYRGVDGEAVNFELPVYDQHHASHEPAIW